MKALLQKDFKNLALSLGPAIFLGVPLLLVMQLTQNAPVRDSKAFLSAFWVAFFFGSTSLFFRSFSQEHASKNFALYSSQKISRMKIFLSQALVQFLGCLLIGIAYGGLAFIFWSPIDVNALQFFVSLSLSALALAPMGTLLGLMLQFEREFLFSVIYLPLATPVILGAYELSAKTSETWQMVLLSFALVGSFVSAFLFEFFFDDLTSSS